MSPATGKRMPRSFLIENRTGVLVGVALAVRSSSYLALVLFEEGGVRIRVEQGQNTNSSLCNRLTDQREGCMKAKLYKQAQDLPACGIQEGRAAVDLDISVLACKLLEHDLDHLPV